MLNITFLFNGHKGHAPLWYNIKCLHQGGGVSEYGLSLQVPLTNCGHFGGQRSNKGQNSENLDIK